MTFHTPHTLSCVCVCSVSSLFLVYVFSLFLSVSNSYRLRLFSNFLIRMPCKFVYTNWYHFLFQPASAIGRGGWGGGFHCVVVLSQHVDTVVVKCSHTQLSLSPVGLLPSVLPLYSFASYAYFVSIYYYHHYYSPYIIIFIIIIIVIFITFIPIVCNIIHSLVKE